MGRLLPLGKLKLSQLDRLLKRYTTEGGRVVVGARVGEDAAVLDFGPTYLLAKTDPITFVTDAIGRYAIQINANDIATMGGIPRWFLATVLLPAGKATEEMAEEIFAQLAQACRELDIAYCGGHTEVTHGIDRPIVVGQMLGEVPRDRLITTAGARVGDALILTKGIAIEGATILARECSDRLLQKFGAPFLDRCKRLLYEPGLSILRDARLALEAGTVHAMHDPTEGGLATGLHELAQAASVGLLVEHAAIPILPETSTLCREFGLDPLGVIASGALLLSVPAEEAQQICAHLTSHGIAAAQIGRVVAPEEGIRMIKEGAVQPLPCYEQDEITKVLGGSR
ncbi:MAG: hydrogenase expression/formation protein [Nitrospirae bacterium]|nr:hydrogenase expression/formation protein [Nitrospirota bacterium]